MKKLIAPIIDPIVVPNVDWHKFVKCAEISTGRSPTRELDAKGVPVGDTLSFLSALQSFQNNSIGNLFRHLSFSFICDTTEKDLQNLILSGTDLKIVVAHGSEGVFILSGTLDIWHREVVEKCNNVAQSQSVRLFYNCIYLIFKTRLNLNIWTIYRRHDLLDETFILTP